MLIWARLSTWKVPTLSAAAQHVVGGRVLLRQLVHANPGRPCLTRHHGQRAADGAEHAQRQDVDLDQAQRVQIVLVPLDDGAVVHGGVFHRHQPREMSSRAMTKPPGCWLRWRGKPISWR
jgi:hypothetical protein